MKTHKYIMIKDFNTYIGESRLGRNLRTSFGDDMRKEDDKPFIKELNKYLKTVKWVDLGYDDILFAEDFFEKELTIDECLEVVEYLNSIDNENIGVMDINDYEIIVGHKKDKKKICNVKETDDNIIFTSVINNNTILFPNKFIEHYPSGYNSYVVFLESSSDDMRSRNIYHYLIVGKYDDKKNWDMSKCSGETRLLQQLNYRYLIKLKKYINK